MIIMRIKAENFYSFTDFDINFSYPKKLTNTTIPNEFLINRPRFRYKKVNIIMGSNASGKTTLGQLILNICNLIIKKTANQAWYETIYDNTKEAEAMMDFILDGSVLYRINVLTTPIKEDGKIDISTCIRKVNINLTDDYEKCADRLDDIPLTYTEDLQHEIDKVDTSSLGWTFSFPRTDRKFKTDTENSKIYIKVLENILRTLDPSIRKVEKLENIDDSYIIWLKDKKLLMQEGRLALDNMLSSGTASGIEIATMLTGIIEDKFGFYYCDERFSFINSDIEQAIISLMIEKLADNSQLFITTHNSDILDMNLPIHSFTFLRKDENGKIKAVYASKYLKKNTDSIKNAVINDVFSTSPNLDLIDELVSINEKEVETNE